MKEEKKVFGFSQYITESSIVNNEGSEPEYLRNIRVEKHGDEDAIEQAEKMIFDGKTPNLFFVTSTNDCMYLDGTKKWKNYYESIAAMKAAPMKLEDHLITTVYGPFEDPKKALEKADKIDLAEDVGPRQVLIQDRLNGIVYEKILKAEQKLVWQDEVITNDLSS